MAKQNVQNRDYAWLSAFPEDQRFRRIAILVLTFTLILSIAIPFIYVPPLEKNTSQPLPKRYAKLILEKKKVEPKKKELSEAEKEALRKAEEERRKKLEEERKKREEELKKKREEEKKKREEERKRLEEQRKKELEEQRKRTAEQKKLDEERRKAEAERRRIEEERRRAEAERKRVEAEKKKGEELAASLFGDLADLSTEAPTTQQKSKLVSASKETTTSKTISSPSLIGSKTAGAGKGTGGIDTARLSQVDTSTAGAGLETRRTTVVEDVDLGVIDGVAGGDDAVTASGKPTRSARELNAKLEAAKGRFNKIYQRALRKDPTLGGKVVLKITILPSGKVENVEVVSSDIADKNFISKLITAVKGINFGARENIGKVTASYPLDFGML